jgi:hypothetical protein
VRKGRQRSKGLVDGPLSRPTTSLSPPECALDVRRCSQLSCNMFSVFFPYKSLSMLGLRTNMLETLASPRGFEPLLPP